MSDGYYRIDATRQDGRAGHTQFVRAANKTAAVKVLAGLHPDVAEWNLEVARIPREEFPVNAEPRLLIIPPINEVIAGADPDDPSDADDKAYNAFATELVLSTLKDMRAEGLDPLVLTQYPHDTVEEGNDSRDLVTLGRHEEVSVIDGGVR